MTTVSPLAFFRSVLRPIRTFMATTIVVLGCAAWMAWADPGHVDQVASLALLSQMFAAATGCRERARRGHFDPVLIAGNSRRLVAAAHGAVSVCPGSVVWILLAVAEWRIHPGIRPTTMSAAGIAAFLWVSATAWALALPLTRYASGIAWLGMLFAIVAASWAEPLREIFQATGHRWTDSLGRTGAALVNPFLLLVHPEVPNLWSLLLIALSAAGVTMIGAAFFASLDSPLGGSS